MDLNTAKNLSVATVENSAQQGGHKDGRKRTPDQGLGGQPLSRQRGHVALEQPSLDGDSLVDLRCNASHVGWNGVLPVTHAGLDT